jgi:hypothetical protein
VKRREDGNRRSYLSEEETRKEKEKRKNRARRKRVKRGWLKKNLKPFRSSNP